jgi:2-polyprenyl-6-methoxyphenol hydroxylase-like FAD-dependent oxidoreductase
MTENGPNKRRALIIGGSLGGLFVGNLLHQIGWDVDIFGTWSQKTECHPRRRRFFTGISDSPTTMAPTSSVISSPASNRNGHPRGYAIPEGLLADRWLEHLRRDAENLLPLPFREVVEATTQPFAQAIRDLASDHMVAGHVVIIGDAAAIPRPHTAASTSKAAANALALADELQASP